MAKVTENDLYDIPALAKVLGITEYTARKLLREKKLKGKKLSKKWYVTGASVKEYFGDAKTT